MIDPVQFKNPKAEYRPAPFWSWNHELIPERLIEQIRSMHEQGLGGYYMHARAGLKTAYLSADWEKAIEACVKEGERLGMFANLYDEDCFPSGNAAGLVTRDHPEFAAQCIVLREGEPADYTSPDGKPYRFEVYTSPPSPRWGAPAPSTTNKAAMARYINITYDWYKEHFGEYFGAGFTNVVPSIFADEPNIATRFARNNETDILGAAPWSAGFKDEFIKRKGYDIRGSFAKLFFDIPGYEKARFDFYDVSFNLFLEAFTKQIYDWCENNNLDFTCHYWEHNYPLTVMQGDVMAHYEYLQIPGIDMLFNEEEEHEHEQFGFDLIVKEVTSAAVQTGKKRVMSETHGAGGWDVSFKDQKRMLDWQFALGINYIVPHLFYLSMQGDRKRDFPLSFINEPWWGEYRILGDYIGRLCYVLSEGDFVADTLVLHNYSTTYAAYSPLSDNKQLLDIGEETRDTLVVLSAGQIYYNLGSENLLARHAQVKNGKICIGGMEYAYLVLPPAITIAAPTVALIAEFKRQGGFIVSTGRKPDMAGGEKSEELIKLLVDVPQAAIGSVAQVLSERGASGLRLAPCDSASAGNMRSIYAHERRIGGKRLLFLCNISRYESAEFMLPSTGAAVEYDCEKGEIKDTPYDGDAIKIRLHPCGSVCYMIDPAVPAKRPDKSAPQIISVKQYKDFIVTRMQDNMLAINSCTVTLGDGWEKSGTATGLNLEVRNHISRGTPNYRRQPWMFTDGEKAEKTPLRARYIFHAEDGISRLRVAAEYPEHFDVFLNGVKLTADGWFNDRDIISYPASHAVRKGENIVELSGKYNIETTIESVYLIGGFTVACPGGSASGGGSKSGGSSGSGARVAGDYSPYIIKDDAAPGLGNAAEQGHPFYCGSISYATEIDVDKSKPGSRVYTRLDGFHGVVAKVFVNDNPVAVLGWDPYEADITDCAAQGKNTLRVDVYSSGQNIFGPHSKLNVKGIVAPGSFYEPDEGIFTPYGLYEGVSIITLG